MHSPFTVVELFKALGDINRLRIVRLLASHPQQTFCVADLAAILGIPSPAARSTSVH
jgi:DNA-binding transcriptional ArsR family regulator